MSAWAMFMAKLGRYDEAIAAFENAAQLRSDGMHPARIARVYALCADGQAARSAADGERGEGTSL
jgi:hypothetical protein